MRLHCKKVVEVDEPYTIDPMIDVKTSIKGTIKGIL